MLFIIVLFSNIFKILLFLLLHIIQLLNFMLLFMILFLFKLLKLINSLLLFILLIILNSLNVIFGTMQMMWNNAMLFHFLKKKSFNFYLFNGTIICIKMNQIYMLIHQIKKKQIYMLFLMGKWTKYTCWFSPKPKKTNIHVVFMVMQMWVLLKVVYY